MSQFVYTEDHSSGLIARLFLGFVILPHGLQKAFGLFGGKGLMPTLESFDASGISLVFGALVIGAEFLGAIALIFGIFGRFMSAGIIAVMIGAMVMRSMQHGFFMNWSGMQEGEGIEYHLLAIGLGLIILVAGSGRLSFDRWLTRRHWG